MLTSLFENNRDTAITVYVLTEGFSVKSIEDISRLAKQYCNKIEIIRVNQRNKVSTPFPFGRETMFPRLPITDFCSDSIAPKHR